MLESYLKDEKNALGILLEKVLMEILDLAFLDHQKILEMKNIPHLKFYENFDFL